ERVGERHGAFHHGQVLAVTERQEEERLLPRRRERVVVAARDALERERDGLRTEGERLCRPAVDRARELVEDDDEGEPPPRRRGPPVEVARGRAREELRKSRDDLGIRAAAEPPFDPP